MRQGRPAKAVVSKTIASPPSFLNRREAKSAEKANESESLHCNSRNCSQAAKVFAWRKRGTAERVAKRLECEELAPAFGCPPRFKSGSKLLALQTLRAIRLRLRCALRVSAV